ncbi:MAG: hypothetical protein ACI83I_001108 [Bacteroidia bacterium]|jgi:hypothetical protein
MLQHACKKYQVPAAVLVFGNADTIYFYSVGKNNRGENVDLNTIFEGASLSKTLFSYAVHANDSFRNLQNKTLAELGFTEPDVHRFIYQKAIVPKKDYSGSNDLLKIQFRALLNHTSHIDHLLNNSPRAIANDSFAYSENGFMLAQEVYEKWAKKPFYTSLVNPGLHFLWQDYFDSDYVDGYFDTIVPERSIRRYTSATSNGSLLCSGAGLSTFLQQLMLHPPIIESYQGNHMSSKFDGLTWRGGFGFEAQGNRNFMWQWGDNYAYNAFYIVDLEKQEFSALLSNSVRSKGMYQTILSQIHGVKYFKSIALTR